ncbi:MAG: PASTA domain-containing protein [Paenibacillaceae bacterium]|uniref:Penicillin-binding transpeptidase domain-containing protein n=1 Tax=Paenibacillus mellifer TaxID=2937794 RepID=A0A9X1XXJ2_9BACL|nr:penicillin-binding transpeptidase domain-containing protein [Paenibacillus mellifer]MBW4839307.1 PASTA domain-containing protein [Paenibacillaceae bacterium]MCK8487840.1 penicillin-binding transpeptidase domain-containing protein [Paenibacillus mellifer]
MIKRIKLRTLLIGGCITLFFAVLMGRAFWLQVVQADFWQAHAEELWSTKKPLPATRGTITDRNGDVLAVDAPAYTVAVNPEIINKYDLQDEVVEGLGKVLGKNESELRDIVNAKKESGEYFTQREVRNEGWKIDQDLRDQVQAFIGELKEKHQDMQDVGIYIIKDQKRYYPNHSLASHVLGYLDREGKAVSGLEAFYDEQLKGIDGSIEYKRDGRGIEIPKASEIYTPAKNGKNLKLTIDYTIQYYIEQAMREAYDQLQPISMTVIAADPNTMEILGMANMPTYNPNEYWADVDQKNFYNHAIKSVYEPGSTFKIVTLAGAVQDGLFNPNATYKSGSIRVPGQTIHDLKRAGWGEISYLEGVKRSSNVAFVKLGYEMLGPERLKTYVDQFGFGKKTGIELPGESKGIVDPVQQADFAAMAYGHGKLLVTPLQQIVAVSAIANGGKLMEPHIVKSITDPQTGEAIDTKPKVIQQILTPDKAKEVGTYLEQVVSDQKIGTGRHAYIDGYRVAGKTGTAVKVVNGQYDYTKQVVSFIGYAPVNDPKIAVIVLIDEPKDSELGGGTAAAPVFKKIVNQTLQYMGVPKKIEGGAANTHSKSTTTGPKVPDVGGLAVQQAKDKLSASGISYATYGKGTEIISQFPKAGSTLKVGQFVYLLTEKGSDINVPNLQGESLRDAMELLSVLQIPVTAEGEGYVVSQEVVNENGGRRVVLTLEPPDKEEASADDGQAEDTGDDDGTGNANGEEAALDSP